MYLVELCTDVEEMERFEDKKMRRNSGMECLKMMKWGSLHTKYFVFFQIRPIIPFSMKPIKNIITSSPNQMK